MTLDQFKQYADNVLTTFEQYVKIAPWLQFVGYMVVAGGLILRHPVMAWVGLGVSMAGFVYKKIYP